DCVRVVVVNASRTLVVRLDQHIGAKLSLDSETPLLRVRPRKTRIDCRDTYRIDRHRCRKGCSPRERCGFCSNECSAKYIWCTESRSIVPCGNVKQIVEDPIAAAYNCLCPATDAVRKSKAGRKIIFGFAIQGTEFRAGG